MTYGHLLTLAILLPWFQQVKHLLNWTEFRRLFGKSLSTQLTLKPQIVTLKYHHLTPATYLTHIQYCYLSSHLTQKESKYAHSPKRITAEDKVIHFLTPFFEGKIDTTFGINIAHTTGRHLEIWFSGRTLTWYMMAKMEVHLSTTSSLSLLTFSISSFI